MNLFQTPKMEPAIIAMMARHKHCVVFRNYACLKKIYLRFNSIPGVTPFLIRSRDSFHEQTLERWRDAGGLLVRSYDAQYPKIPDCDAIMFPEAPLQYRYLESYVGPSVKEVICYRPPSWKLHEATVEFKFPSSDSHKSIMAVVDGLAGRSLTPRLQAALDLSGFDGTTTAVFEASEMEAITGISERQFKPMLHMASLKIKYERYQSYVPTIRPDDLDQREFYDRVVALPDSHRGERMLRFGNFPGLARLDGQFRLMRLLARQGNLSTKPHIYLVRRGVVAPDFTVIDGICNARRADWVKMRDAIDAAPVYQLGE